MLIDSQFGFREHHSTWQPLLLTLNYIEKAIKEKKHILLISCDLAKAFDTCQHGILNEKIKFFSKNNCLANWIDSYYKDREQYTLWNCEKSNTLKNFPISIVQGSSLGPKAFNLYLNDIIHCTESFSVLFADDTNFLLSFKDHRELEKVANKELSIIKDYFDANGLTISIQKTSYIHFRPKGQSQKEITLAIGNETLKEVNELTFLGVVIDRKLNFDSHFHKVYKKASNGLRGLILAKNFLTYKAKKTIYHSLIHSHITYCDIGLTE